jgi:hypothetical protein
LVLLKSIAQAVGGHIDDRLKNGESALQTTLVWTDVCKLDAGLTYTTETTPIFPRNYSENWKRRQLVMVKSALLMRLHVGNVQC